MRFVLLSILLINALFSRDNPFIPTQTFVDEKESVLETKHLDNNLRTNKKDSKNEEDIKKSNLNEQDSMNLVVQSNPIGNNNNDINQNNLQINDELIRHTQPFPYLDIFEYKNSFVVKSKYKIIKKFMIYNPYKIAIDFKADVPQKSQVIRLDNPLFEKIVFGNHKKDGFFRIVMYPKENPYHYERDYTDYVITMIKRH